MIAVIFALIIVIVAVVVFRLLNPPLPEPGSDTYRQMVSAFYSGAIALDAGDSSDAPGPLKKATKIVPGEPAAWADLGLYNLMPETRNLALAEQYLNKAHSLASKNSDVEALLGSLEQVKGNYDLAVDHLATAVTLDSSNVKARYRLAQVIAQQSAPDSDTKQEEQLQAILAIQPNNLVALLELGYLAAKNKQHDLLSSQVSKIAAQAPSWPRASASSGSDPLVQLKTVQKVAASNDPQAAIQVKILENDLNSSPGYQQSLTLLGANSVGASSEASVGAPITHFILMPSPPSTPAAPDKGLTFTSAPIPASGPSDVCRPLWLNLDTPDALATVASSNLTVSPASGAPIKLAFPGKAAGPESVLPIDWNDDTQIDLALAGSSGVKLYQQTASGPVAFTDVTSRSKLPPNIASGSYTGAWTATLETGGEADIVLGAKSGPITALRNNSDGTFTPIQPFPGASNGLHAFAWTDFDNDGLSDAALVDNQGRLAIYHNEASGIFASWAIPSGFEQVVAICGADLNRTGSFGLIGLGQDGSLKYLALK
ncbi:MAG TPA: FG-GAP-like repeat-containing protein, partial [Capsulimonadaceae bacterium]|nr:FG-GAP-like repeat-containing protein [Capsulimonadaceae bacterium]